MRKDYVLFIAGVALCLSPMFLALGRVTLQALGFGPSGSQADQQAMALFLGGLCCLILAVAQEPRS